MWQGNGDHQAGAHQAGAARTDGITAGTPIATPQGWRWVESLQPGDQVLTFEAGAQRLLAVETYPFDDVSSWPRDHWPLHVPLWALDNREDILLLPDQHVLIESDAADALYGDPFALIPALALNGFRGIDQCRPPEGSAAVRLGFDADQIVYAARGALLSCPEPQLGLHHDIEALKRRAARGDYPALSDQQARELVTCLIAEDVGVALRAAKQRPGPYAQDQAAFF